MRPCVFITLYVRYEHRQVIWRERRRNWGKVIGRRERERGRCLGGDRAGGLYLFIV